jgi:hypothetical protein
MSIKEIAINEGVGFSILYYLVYAVGGGWGSTKFVSHAMVLAQLEPTPLWRLSIYKSRG